MCCPYTKTNHRDRFAYSDKWNSYLLTSWGCFQRHYHNRWEEQYNEPYWQHWGDWDMPMNADEYEDMQVLYTAIKLIKNGNRPHQQESLCEFVARKG